MITDAWSTAENTSNLLTQNEFTVEIRAQARAHAFAPLIDAHFSTLSWKTSWTPITLTSDLIKPRAGQSGGILFLIDAQHHAQGLTRLLPTLKHLHPVAAIVVVDNNLSPHQVAEHIRAGADDVISMDATDAMEIALMRVARSLERLAIARIREAQTQLFQAAIEQSPVSVIITDMDAHIRFVNTAFCQSTGYSREEVMGRDPRFLRSGEQPPESYESLWSTVAAGLSWSGEFHNKRKDGSTFWERAHVTPVRNDVGLITHYLAVKEDITAQKINEQVLRETTQTLRATQAFALLADWTYDTQTQDIVSHRGLGQLVGIPEHGPITLEKLLVRVADESRDSLREKIQHAAIQGLDLTATVASADHPRRWFTIRGQPIFNASGNAVQLRGFLQDITQLEFMRQALAASEERYRRLFHDSPSAMLLIDSNSNKIVDANTAASKLYGYPPTTLIGTVASALVASPAAERSTKTDFTCSGKQQCQQCTADGSILDIECHIIGIDVGDQSYRLCSIVDVSEHKRWQRAQQQWAVLFNNAREGMIITDHETRIRQVNRAFSEITGYSLSDVLGKTPKILNSGHHDAAFYHAMWEMIDREGSWSGEIWNRRKDGTVYPEWLSISSIRDAAGKAVNYLAVFTDISSMKETQAQLVYLAHHDPLTGLPNRLMFMDRLNHAIEVAQRANSQFAVLFLDLDNFKRINDTLGHAEGDHLLCTVARRLRGLVRSADTVARLGGDEFILLLENVPCDMGIETVAAKVLESLTQPVSLSGLSTDVSTSIGIAVYPRDGQDATTLLRHADSAMYKAKRSGRNRYHVYVGEVAKRA